MLYQVDIARKQSCGHIVEAWHGRVAEAVFREWLAQFLPKRFAVTSGYIISQAFTETAPTPHYDVIIYDQLAAPILWVERSPDSSVLGRAVAVPAEHVAAVIEVKSALTPATARDSVRKLREIQPLVLRHDDPDPYHFYLPQHFSCGVVFFHLPRKHEFSAAALNNLLPRDHHLNKYDGGMVLAGEGKDVGLTGRLDLVGGPEVVGRSNVGRHRASLFETYSPL